MTHAQAFGEFEFLRTLTETPGVPGREELVRELILEHTADLWDETRVDAMGNLICLKKAASPAKKPRRGSARKTGSSMSETATPLKVMIACHMDEIGFYVRHIDDEGRLRIQNVGGFDTRNLFARKVLVQGRKPIAGVLNPAGKPIHISSAEERNKIPEIREFYVDLFMPKSRVSKLVEIGDPVTLVQQTEMIGDGITGKAMDNRVALWVGINAVRKACGLGYLEMGNGTPAVEPGSAALRRTTTGTNHLRYDTYFVACVQEEVGLRGATTAAYGVDPDIGIAIDTTLCCDTPGVNKEDTVTEWGKGVGIKVMDGASISHRGLFEEFAALAKKKKIAHQFEVLPRGGTDAGALQKTRAGTRAITLSVPTRYIHTVTETINKKDAKSAVDLLSAWLSV